MVKAKARKTKRRGKRKKSSGSKAPATPKIENMDPSVLKAVDDFHTEEFVAGEIEKNRIAANRRMDEHMRRMNQSSRRSSVR